MRIAILKSDLGQRGGVEKYSSHLANAFVKKGCSVTVLTTHRDGASILSPYHFDCPLISLGKKASLSFLHLRDFDRWCSDWLKQHPVDVVFGMDRNSFQTHYRAGNGVHAEYLRKRAQVETLFKKISFKINPLHKQILHYEKQAYCTPSLRTLFTNSHMVRQEILAHYPVDQSKVKVVHNGVEWQALQKPFDEWQHEREHLLTQFNLDRSRYQFLFMGHGYRRKGLEQLLKGLALLPRAAFHLSVVGKDKEAAYFQSLVHTLNLSENVRFFGSQNNPHAFYQMADALIIPSIYDPFANVTLEALAMGLFVVSSKTNGGHEILNVQNGKVIDHLFRPETVAEALQHAMKHPKTAPSASLIRASVRSYDFSDQLQQIVQHTLS